jgi:hypothetical protein
MHVNFGHLIPRVWRTLRGVGGMNILIMGMLRVLDIVLYLLNFCEGLHGFIDGFFDCCKEGVID